MARRDEPQVSVEYLDELRRVERDIVRLDSKQSNFEQLWALRYQAIEQSQKAITDRLDRMEQLGIRVAIVLGLLIILGGSGAVRIGLAALGIKLP
jgi:hypothetical protein